VSFRFAVKKGERFCIPCHGKFQEFFQLTFKASPGDAIQILARKKY